MIGQIETSRLRGSPISSATRCRDRRARQHRGLSCQAAWTGASHWQRAARTIFSGLVRRAMSPAAARLTCGGSGCARRRATGVPTPRAAHGGCGSELCSARHATRVGEWVACVANLGLPNGWIATRAQAGAAGSHGERYGTECLAAQRAHWAELHRRAETCDGRVSSSGQAQATPDIAQARAALRVADAACTHSAWKGARCRPLNTGWSAAER